ncbi:MAG TPA: alpha/beta hydrolase [Gammaproteobacteria bacterium]|nr:alpha/beta hydrolase [Gammaproteobacteria bacterium]
MPLHPQIQQMLDQLYASGWKEVSGLTVAEARAQSDYYASLRKFPQPIPDVKTYDHSLPRESGQQITLRVYQPSTTSFDATIIFYHGGGYVLSNLQAYDVFCRWMCAELGANIVSVDYRLAPEYPFPTPIEDGYAALEWVATQRKKLDLDDKHIIVVGDSAGAHLATMVSILSRDRKGPKIDGQWLFYPWVDNDLSRNSYNQYAQGYSLTTAGMQWFDQHFRSQNKPAAFPTYPMKIDNLAGLPPAVIIPAECDPLRDEGFAYAKKLQEAGNVVLLHEASGMVHGFINQYAVPASFAATMEAFKLFKQSRS